MSRFSGSSSVEIAASPAACFELVCDTPRTPLWHQAITAVEVLELDVDGRTGLVRAELDARIARVVIALRLDYLEPRVVHMTRESGALRHLTATWTFEELDAGLTRADFRAELDPGPVLSRLARGPVLTQIRALLAEQPPAGLKHALEEARSPSGAGR